MSGNVRYPVPLDPLAGRWAYLDLPSDLTQKDVERILRVLRTLLLPDEPPGGHGIDGDTR